MLASLFLSNTGFLVKTDVFPLLEYILKVFYLPLLLFLKGSKSEYIEIMDEILIKKHFPKAKIIEVLNAGHWLHAENPSEFSQFVMNFV
jgi:hypothetical protein